MVARVYDKYLYQEDIEAILPKNLNAADSSAFVNNYVNVWAKDQLMIYKAEFNLSAQQKDFEEQITAYRNDLLKFAYQQQYIEQNLDTNISLSAIRKFYEENPDNFILRENILKARYLIVPLDAPKSDKAESWFKSSEEEDKQALMDYALQYARQFSLTDSSWKSFDFISRQIPVNVIEQEDFLRNNKYSQIRDSLNLYMFEIIDYRLKGNQAPLSYSSGLIRNIQLNQRKLNIISDLEKNLLEDAINKKEFETF